MPTYHYRCNSCKHEFEELQSISEEALVECPSCHQPTLVRLIAGGAGLVFKGSGFYLTDYKKSSSSPASNSQPAKKESGGSGESSSGPAPAPESSPAKP